MPGSGIHTRREGSLPFNSKNCNSKGLHLTDPAWYTDPGLEGNCFPFSFRFMPIWLCFDLKHILLIPGVTCVLHCVWWQSPMAVLLKELVQSELNLWFCDLIAHTADVADWLNVQTLLRLGFLCLLMHNLLESSAQAQEAALPATNRPTAKILIQVLDFRSLYPLL